MAGDYSSSTHPPLPPTTEDDRLNRLRLLRSRRVGVSTFHRLIAEHGDAAAALAALPRVAAEAGVTRYTPCPEDAALAELDAGHRIGARLLVQGDPDWPAMLDDLSDAPPLLWAMGDISLLSRPMIALVGARNASSLGTRMAAKLAAELGETGYVTVSGLARGVDAAVHRATLSTGTVAVLGGGVDVLYPVENAELARDIAGTGLRLSEQPPGLQPQARHFPARNRIISGLARAVVVVEAASRSGSLITARNALDQGREVMAVPGHPFDARAAGCNLLIRDGATLVRGARDVVEALGPIADAAPELPLEAPGPAPAPAMKSANEPRRPLRETAALHAEILSRLGPAPLAEDQLIRDLKARATEVGSALVDLELEGEIQRQPGGLLSRVV